MTKFLCLLAYLEDANRAGRCLNLPVRSIDKLILDSLVENSSLAALSINDTIQKAFLGVASETDLVQDPGIQLFQFQPPY